MCKYILFNEADQTYMLPEEIKEIHDSIRDINNLIELQNVIYTRYSCKLEQITGSNDSCLVTLLNVHCYQLNGKMSAISAKNYILSNYDSKDLSSILDALGVIPRKDVTRQNLILLINQAMGRDIGVISIRHKLKMIPERPTHFGLLCTKTGRALSMEASIQIIKEAKQYTGSPIHYLKHKGFVIDYNMNTVKLV